MTVEAIIVLGIAAVCRILLTNRFNLIGPVLLIAAGAGASFIPGTAEAWRCQWVVAVSSLNAWVGVR